MYRNGVSGMNPQTRPLWYLQTVTLRIGRNNRLEHDECFKMSFSHWLDSMAWIRASCATRSVSFRLQLTNPSILSVLLVLPIHKCGVRGSEVLQLPNNVANLASAPNLRCPISNLDLLRTLRRSSTDSCIVVLRRPVFETKGARISERR